MTSLATHVEWDSILDNLDTGRSIICLGAELFSTSAASLDAQIRQVVGESANVRAYNDGLFHFKGAGDLTSHTKIKKFFNGDFPEVAAVLEKIAFIKCPVVISMNPDRHLEAAFRRLGLPCQYAYHFPRNPASELNEPDADNPLIYNLLGDINSRESMTLTHEDVFNFLESVVEGRSLSPIVKARVKAANNFIFLGLPFEKWYMQLLLRVVQKETNKIALRYAANNALDDETQTFCLDQFNITCVPTRITDFVDELYTRCAQAGLLRGSGAQPELRYDRWRKMLKRDELSDLLYELSDFFEKNYPDNTHHHSHLAQLSGRLANLERRASLGAVDNRDAGVERSQIRDAVNAFLTNEGKEM